MSLAAAAAVLSLSAVSFIAATAASLSLSCSMLVGWDWDSTTLGFWTRGMVAGVEVITVGFSTGLSVVLSLPGVAGRQKGGGGRSSENKVLRSIPST